MKIRLELISRTVEGVYCPYPRVMLSVRDVYGMLVSLPFRIDTGADRSAIPVTTADLERIPYQAREPVIAAGLVGTTTKFRGQFRVVIGRVEHEWPCDFINVPRPALGRIPDRLLGVPVLGRAGFLEDYSVCLDSHFLVLTRLGPVRKWYRRRLYAAWTWLGVTYPEGQPL